MSSSMFLKTILLVIFQFSLRAVANEIKVVELTDELSKALQRDCQGAMPAAEVVVDGLVTTRAYSSAASRVLDMTVRPDDIWIVSVPKVGQTWVQEMVWLLKNNLDYQSAAKTPLLVRYSFLEYRLLWGDRASRLLSPIVTTLTCRPPSKITSRFSKLGELVESYLPPSVVPDMIKVVDSRASPRFVMTHLPVHLMPRQVWTAKPKIIYVTRNPKDVAISYFYHFQMWNNYKGTKEQFFKAFVADKVVYSPYWDHVRAYWGKKSNENIHFIAYEDMKKDLSKVIQDTAAFLSVTINDADKKKLIEHLSFNSMRNNPSVNLEDDRKKLDKKYGVKNSRWLRKGEVGQWKTEFSPEINEMFDQWIAKNRIPDLPMVESLEGTSTK